MTLPQTLLLVVAMLMLALLLRPFTLRRNIPFAAVLVAAGFLTSELIVAFGADTGLRASAFHDLILYVFLPVLVFEAAFRIDAEALLRNLVPILFLALPVMLLSAAISAILLYFGIAHPTGFPWIAALLTGALLSATDPAAVAELFVRPGVPKRLILLVEGEALFNDAAAIVVFAMLLEIALQGSGSAAVEAAVGGFLFVFFGGLLVGLVCGVVFLWISRLVGDVALQGLVTLVSAYASYLVADVLIQVSGVMSILATGLVMSRVIHADFAEGEAKFVSRLWEMNAFLCNSLVFLLMGAVITVDMFTERWLAILIGVASVLVARAVGIFAFSPLMSRLPRVEPIDLASQRLLYWGGVRGAVTLALALSLPVELDYWWTIQSIAFGVVLFNVLVQAPTLPMVIRQRGQS